MIYCFHVVSDANYGEIKMKTNMVVFNKIRKEVSKPSKAFTDKSKYNRKEKHKGNF